MWNEPDKCVSLYSMWFVTSNARIVLEEGLRGILA